MATLVLSTIGTAVGTSLGGPIGGFVGSTLGKLAGGAIDNAIFGPTKLAPRSGPRLENLAVQTSTYGKMLPILYGTVRVAGNIIWSRPIQEEAVTTTVSSGGGKGGGGSVEQDQTEFRYSVTLAVALSEGPIDEVVRVWADAKLITPEEGKYRLYKGDEEQLPDSIIESFEGADSTPAYRGTAYVVMEDFPLGAYGNRIPNFTFEVKRKLIDTGDGEVLENLITAMIMIPGSGEFVYDTQVQSKVPGYTAGSTWIQQGPKTPINQNSNDARADALVALDQLLATCPNLEWIGLVVTWFGTDVDAGACEILPGVEYQTGAKTEPDTWGSGSFTRATAHQLTVDENGRPVYGGTPSDACIVRYLDAIRDYEGRDLKVMLYPMFFMDTENKPWRGRVTGSATDVANFFTKTNGYNAFITHYANLAAGHCDAFVIGSELIGLTKVYTGTTSRTYPAVDALVSLAATVKGIVGSGVKVAYAADWSEYHHTDDGWYNLDPLWASPNIDIIGIDAYFPLSNQPQSGYSTDDVIEGWGSGEGFTYYYTDPGRTTTAPLAAPYAWKDIGWWWSNTHTNPDGNPTGWVPQSKPIWFTEYGFPSVDGAINQPNVFYDPSSSESFFPRLSKGRVDFRAQRQGLLGTELYWADSEMVHQKFIWTWDARPYPYYPDLGDVWGDGNLWRTGHWVSGKLGLSGLAAIVRDICLRAGLDDAAIDVTGLNELVDGYAIVNQTSARDAIEQLMQGFMFDAAESGDVLSFQQRGAAPAVAITEAELLPVENKARRDTLSITRVQELELPKRVEVLYLNRIREYQTGAQHSKRGFASTDDVETLSLPIAMVDQQAKNIADIRLYTRWLERTQFTFELPLKYAYLEPADVISVTTDSAAHIIRLTAVDYAKPGALRVKGVAEDVSVYDFYSAPGEASSGTVSVPVPPATRLEILDLPMLPGDDANSPVLRFVATGEGVNWRGGVIYRSDDGGSAYNLLTSVAAGVVGNAEGVLGDGVTHLFDEENEITVTLMSGELSGVSELALLNGANAALIGDEIIQFQNAELLSAYKYKLSKLLRGRLGTEHATGSHAIGDRFVLLSGGLVTTYPGFGAIGITKTYKPVSVGSTLATSAAVEFTYSAHCLKPFAPVHVSGSRDVSDNLTIAWVRRARVQGEWRDYADAPLAEESEAYEIDILDGADVVRTLTATSASTTYSAAEQTLDFGSPQSSVDVRIHQLSAIVGRGTAAEATI